MSFFNSEKKSIYFITKNFKGMLIERSILILSPEFYWTKKANLNLKYTYEANKMASSIFDGILPPGIFKYKVIKLGKNEFIFIAYDIQNILSELEHIGIDLHMVEKIYVAQSELMGNDLSLKVDDKYAIVSSENIITYLPLKLLNSQVDTNVNEVLETKKLSSNYIYSKSFQKLNVNSKELNLILWLLIILTSMLVLNVLKIQKDRKFLIKEKSSLIQKYNLPTTSFQIKSMQNELSRIDLKQNNLKKAIIYLGKFKLSKNEFFDLLYYKDSKLKFAIKFPISQRENEFKKYIAKKFKILKIERIKSAYLIEVSI